MEEVRRYVERGDYHSAAVSFIERVSRAENDEMEDIVEVVMKEIEKHGFWRHAAWYLIAEMDRRIKELSNLRERVGHPRELYLLSPGFHYTPLGVGKRIDEEAERLSKLIQLLRSKLREEERIVSDIKERVSEEREERQLEDILERAIRLYRHIYGFEVREKLPERTEGSVYQDALRVHSPLYQLIWKIAEILSLRKGTFVAPATYERK